MTDLRLGDWREVLAEVEEVDALLSDPPYGERTHKGHDAAEDFVADGIERQSLIYSAWSPDDVREFVAHWAPRTRSWLGVMSCSDLSPVYRQAFDDAGLVSFAPVPCVIRGMTVRRRGDGPSSWAVYLNLARKRGVCDGARNGAYIVTRDPGHIGGKPLELMTAIVKDYARPGQLIVDPCAGLGTTLIAAEALGVRSIGAEVDPETHAKALARMRRGVQRELFA